MANCNTEVGLEKLVKQVYAAQQSWSNAFDLIKRITNKSPLFSTAQVHAIMEAMTETLSDKRRNCWDDHILTDGIEAFYKIYYNSTTDDALCEKLKTRMKNAPPARTRKPPSYLTVPLEDSPADVFAQRPPSPFPSARAPSGASAAAAPEAVYNSQASYD